ncbi:MAG TPA: aminopeptidase [Solirubrobacteraceae bacterium]|nr:aminopeptidase [Solirubrobacteraceae bacterium]
MSTPDELTEAIARLAVEFGANVQPGQVVLISSEPAHAQLARAAGKAAYARGALFVDLAVSDPQLKRARALHAAPDALGYVPPWLGQRIVALGELHGSWITLRGPSHPHALDDIDPELAGRDMLPRVPESLDVVNAATTNWTIVPCPTPGWAELVHPELSPESALVELWADVVRVCRLDEPDPVAAWRARIAQLGAVEARLNELALDALHFEGPGTDLRIGLLPGSRWVGTSATTVDGVEFNPNVPSEEVFTAPDPERVEGTVRSTKPLFANGTSVFGLRMRFARGRAVEIDAEQGADVVRAIAARDQDASRLGEVALVDRESRIGQLGVTFYETLLDENAASHIALGSAYDENVGDEYRSRINRSGVHLDFMIGSDEVSVTGLAADGTRIPLLRGGDWQML